MLTLAVNLQKLRYWMLFIVIQGTQLSPLELEETSDFSKGFKWQLAGVYDLGRGHGSLA